MKAVLKSLLFCAIASAQFPGQYPPGQYPPGRYPGRYPPGQYPPGPTPPNGRGQDGPPTMKRGKNAQNTSVPITTFGIFRTSAGKQFVLEADDYRIITYRMTPQTSVL